MYKFIYVHVCVGVFTKLSEVRPSRHIPTQVIPFSPFDVPLISTYLPTSWWTQSEFLSDDVYVILFSEKSLYLSAMSLRYASYLMMFCHILPCYTHMLPKKRDIVSNCPGQRCGRQRGGQTGCHRVVALGSNPNIAAAQLWRDNEYVYIYIILYIHFYLYILCIHVFI